MKEYSEIIIRPLLTEKNNLLSETQNKYIFQVFKNANKIEIKKSIEERFDVKVKKVSTMNYYGKNKNNWMPNAADRDFVMSLMTPITQPGKMAGWLAPPSRGIHGKDIDYEYVKLN